MQITPVIATFAVALLVHSAQTHHQEDHCKCHLPSKLTGRIYAANKYSGHFYYDFDQKLYITNMTLKGSPGTFITLYDNKNNKTIFDRVDSRQICRVFDSVPMTGLLGQCVPKDGHRSGHFIYSFGDNEQSTPCTPKNITELANNRTIKHILHDIKEGSDSHLSDFANKFDHCEGVGTNYVIG